MDVQRLDGSEPFSLSGDSIGATVLDFWRWSSSDIIGNRLRGHLAEFVVAKALDCATGVRAEWDAIDLVSHDGTKIEVKSSSYVQSWAQTRPSRITFDIQPKQAWDATTNTWSEHPIRSADVYVFCVLGSPDRLDVNPLDLEQWDFHCLPSRILDEQLGNQQTLALSRLQDLGAIQVSYRELKKAVVKCRS